MPILGISDFKHSDICPLLFLLGITKARYLPVFFFNEFLFFHVVMIPRARQ